MSAQAQRTGRRGNLAPGKANTRFTHEVPEALPSLVVREAGGPHWSPLDRCQKHSEVARSGD